MGVGAIIAAVGVAVSAAGTGFGIMGQMKAADASKKADALRERQMNLDAMRSKREAIRKNLIANANAQSIATNQGASESSALAGALGENTGVTGRNMQGIEQNRTIGAGIFAANRQIAAGESISSLGQGLGSLGGMFINNAQQFGRVFGSA